ncbi:MAG: AAA family ATPase [Lachnospiraceae bacterium]|nr:AAA family ATPase [Lachnospiraceae bacterium]
MNIREFKECVEFNIKHGLRHAVLGLGAPGVGKSQAVKQIGEKYGYKVIDLRLAQMSEVEIGGLIYPNEDHTKTRWLSPEILPDEERDGKNTILLLDEITSCSKRVQVAAYQLILDRRVGQYTLPEGTFVIGLGNREDDEGVYIRLASPLADRFEIHNIDVDFSVWKNDYAVPYGIHPYVLKYLVFKPAALHTQSANPDSMVFATPRSWERVSNILKCDSDISNPVVLNKIAGNIGMTEANQFVGFVKKAREMVNVDDFLDGRAAVPKDPSEMVMLINAMAEKLGFLRSVTSPKELDRGQRKLVERVLEAMFSLGSAEYTIIGLRELLTINRGTVKKIFLEGSSRRIEKFIAENMSVLGLDRDQLML